MIKVYNVGAHGIPPFAIEAVVALRLNLRYTPHALREALGDRYGVLPAFAFPQSFGLFEGCWTLVEAETFNGILSKFVVRRPVDATRSLVLVILVSGTVKTLWTNLNTDKHATLDKSCFDKP